MNNSKNSIRIAGAGPAGLTAAIILARAGRSVIVWERGPEVGRDHNSDFESIENFITAQDMWEEFASWGLVKNFLCVPINSLTCFGPGFQRAVELSDARPLFYVIVRGARKDSLEHGLLEQALKVGVRVEYNHSARPEEVDIVATGLVRARAYAVGYQFRTNAPNACCVCLDDTLTPKSYSYLILCEGWGTIGAGAIVPQKGLKENLPRIVEGYRSKLGFDIIDPTYFAAPLGFGIPETAQMNGQLYVGEAADLQDSFTGFGIRSSMTTGQLAARSILENSDYDQLWRKRYMPLLKTSAVNRMLQQLGGNVLYSLTLLYARQYERRAYTLLHRHYQPFWLTQVLWPLARRRFLDEWPKK